jgi:hypothetical protein
MLKVKVDLEAWFRIALLTATSGSLARSFPNSKPVPVHTYLLSNTQWLRFFFVVLSRTRLLRTGKVRVGVGLSLLKSNYLVNQKSILSVL